jgi:cobalt-zinc-cadmium efflux system membrane fusion protein
MKTKNLILLLLITFISCREKERENENPVKENDNVITLSPSQVSSLGVKTVVPGRRNISSLLKVNGKIEVPPQNVVSVCVPIGGYLRSTQLLPGLKVKKGEVIAVIEDQQYVQLQQDYLTARLNLAFDEKEFQRQKELNLSKASSDKTFQQSEANYLSQKVKLKALGEKLKLIGINPDKLDENNMSKSINIYSPIDGFVSKVRVNVGKYVNPTDEVFELVNPEDIHLNLIVYEKDVDKLYIGQKLVAYNNYSDKKYNCEIILISQNVSADRSVEVHCHFDNYDKSLIPGMFMNAEITLTSHNALSVPEEAVLNFGGKENVIIDRGGNTYEIKAIEAGNHENGFVEIKSGLPSEDLKIVSRGAYSILSALKNKEEGE